MSKGIQERKDEPTFRIGDKLRVKPTGQVGTLRAVMASGRWDGTYSYHLHLDNDPPELSGEAALGKRPYRAQDLELAGVASDEPGVTEIA